MSYDNEKVKRRRAEAAANGKCSICVTGNPAPGYKTCQACIDRAARARLSGVTWCVDCQASGFHRDDCSSGAARLARRLTP